LSGTRADARKARESQPIPGGDKAKEMAHLHRLRERRREVARDALAAVYSGAGFLEADALLDQLDTLGARIEVRP
jgi:biotin carboxylase